MSDEFGDFEIDDEFSDDGEPAPEQVAVRLHELRMLLEELADRVSTRWEDLSPDEQTVGYDIATAMVPVILEDDADIPYLAVWLHELRESLDYLEDTVIIPPWHLLTDEERVVAHDLVYMLMEWLVRQGAVR